jgi:hypothetical protein
MNNESHIRITLSNLAAVLARANLLVILDSWASLNGTSLERVRKYYTWFLITSDPALQGAASGVHKAVCGSSSRIT